MFFLLSQLLMLTRFEIVAEGYTNGGMNGMHHVESRGKQRAPTTKKQDKKQQNEQQRGPIMEDKIRRTV